MFRQIDATVSADRADIPGQQERQSMNIAKVEKLIFSQENAPGTHKSPREIEQSRGLQEVSL